MYLNNCDILDLADGTAIVRGRCSVTGIIHATRPVPLAAIDDYRNRGGYARDLFPMLSPPECEFLISGTSPEGWRVGVLGLRADSYDGPAPEPVRRAGEDGTTTVVIDRSRWARARCGFHRVGGPMFDGGAYDCLGFYCQQVYGVSDDRLLGCEVPADLGIHDLGEVADRLILLNDYGSPEQTRPWTDQAAQEAAIAEEFEKVGITVQFIN